MAGARVREAIRIYVEVDTYNDDGYVKVTYARTIIAELNNTAQRTEILVSTTIPKMSTLEVKKRKLPFNQLPKESPVQTGLFCTRKGLEEMYHRLKPLERKTSPFEETPKIRRRIG